MSLVKKGALLILGCGLGLLADFEDLSQDWILEGFRASRERQVATRASIARAGFVPQWPEPDSPIYSQFRRVLRTDIGGETFEVRRGPMELEFDWTGGWRTGRLIRTGFAEYRAHDGRSYWLVDTGDCAEREWRDRDILLVEVPRENRSRILAVDANSPEGVRIVREDVMWDVPGDVRGETPRLKKATASCFASSPMPETASWWRED